MEESEAAYVQWDLVEFFLYSQGDLLVSSWK